MLAGLNGLDYTIIGIIAFGALYGLGRGVLRMGTSILSLAIGIYAASLYWGVAAVSARRLGANPALSTIIGYVAVFVIVFVAIEYAGRRVIGLVRMTHLNVVDRLGGAVFGGAVAAVFAGLMVVGLTSTMRADSPLLRDSKLEPRVLAYNQALLAYIPPDVKKAYEEKRQELVQFWKEKAKAAESSSSRDR